MSHNNGFVKQKNKKKNKKREIKNCMSHNCKTRRHLTAKQRGITAKQNNKPSWVIVKGIL